MACPTHVFIVPPPLFSFFRLSTPDRVTVLADKRKASVMSGDYGFDGGGGDDDGDANGFGDDNADGFDDDGEDDGEDDGGFGFE